MGDQLIAAMKQEVSTASPLERNLQTLKEGEMPAKVDALVSMNDILQDPNCVQELIDKADMLIEALAIVAANTFQKTDVDHIPLRFAKYYLNIVYKACSTSRIVREASEHPIFQLTEVLLNCLLIDELEHLGEKREGASMVRLINAAMFKLLENGNPTKTFLSMIFLFKKYKGSGNRILNLTAKCALKLTKVMASLVAEIDILRLLESVQEYAEIPIKDEVGKMAIKTILTEIGTLQPQEIWEAVEKLDMPNTEKLRKWMSEITKPAPPAEE
jgi:hypothetical protein